MLNFNHEELAFEYAKEGLEAFYERKYNKAALSIQEALNHFKEAGNIEEYAKNLNLLGVIYGTIGNETMAIDFFLEGLEYAQEKELHYLSLLFYNNIGSRYMLLHDYEKALVYFLKSEQQMSYDNVRNKERFTGWFLITKLNLMLSYKELGQYEMAEKYLIEIEPYSKLEENKEFYFSFLISKYLLYWFMGRHDEVYANLDAIMEGALNDSSASDYDTDMKDACTLLKEMGEFDRWKQIILAFEAYTKEQESVNAKIALTQMWMDYCKTTGDKEKYTQLCVEYVRLNEEQNEINDKERIAAIDMKIALQDKERARKKAEQKSNTDSLTYLGNRYMLEHDVLKMVKNGNASDKKMAFGILDVDCFKELNDTYGHLHGDDGLRKVAEILRDETKEYGKAYRYGGDEFVILLQDVKKEDVESIAVHIKTRIMGLHIENKNSTAGENLTVSQGYLVFAPNEDCCLDELLQKADKALYHAKGNGKNGYVIC